MRSDVPAPHWTASSLTLSPSVIAADNGRSRITVKPVRAAGDARSFAFISDRVPPIVCMPVMISSVATVTVNKRLGGSFRGKRGGARTPWSGPAQVDALLGLGWNRLPGGSIRQIADEIAQPLDGPRVQERMQLGQGHLPVNGSLGVADLLGQISLTIGHHHARMTDDDRRVCVEESLAPFLNAATARVRRPGRGGFVAPQ